jgi:hypothetical protein
MGNPTYQYSLPIKNGNIGTVALRLKVARRVMTNPILHVLPDLSA